MQPGDVLDRRYELKERAGKGGMGEVFRALDHAVGQPVAIKVLHRDYAGDATRFLREGNVLARFFHRGIVRYVAQGTAPSGAPYLVMEWLEGEDLGTRLRRGPLDMDEAITLTARAADALAAVHSRGIIHRDLKPKNLFLVRGDVALVKLLDFGVACLPDTTRMTHSGVILGTPAYMAPEQASWGQPIDSRADVFALGSVLFECLTGRPAFSGVHFREVLLKIVLAEVPRARELRPEVPTALDALCARMLSKDPDARPSDGAAVAAAIDALGLGSMFPAADSRRPSERNPVSLTQKERRVRSVLLMRPEEGKARPEAETQIVAAPEEMRRDTATFGGQLELLADGSILVTLDGAGLATDQAAQAARCALSLRAHAGGRPMALATGRVELSGRLPASDLIDRALETHAQAAGCARAAGQLAIAIDEVTAGLLDARFEIAETEEGLWLHGEKALAKGARTLLGKPTACVGRDWEITTLDALLTECIEESRARAALLTAPAGMGKTRIAYELLHRVEQRDTPVALWTGRGDPLRAGVPLGLLSQALRGAFAIHDGEALDARRHKVEARVHERVSAGDARRISEFLGELLGTPFPDDNSVQLRAARADSRLLGDQMRRAWMDFLRATCNAQPLLLVLEDLHWGDLPTVQYIDEALRGLDDKPWLVLALARPEVHELFPRLWADRGVLEIRLKSLNHKAGTRLVRQALGNGVSAETVERLVAQANGNAFYLEELIRAAADGMTGALPETVLAMVQSRIEALDDAARRVLRAGSIFGKVFWRGALDALLGSASILSIEEHLERLEQQEWISSQTQSKLQGERELSFRHDLVHEAAYGMLTENDRALGHRLAGEWLKRAAEPPAAVIAEHFDRGGVWVRAVEFYRRAAAQALAANDFGAVLARTDRALALGASGETCGELLLLRTEAHVRRGDLIEAATGAQKAMDLLPKGTAPWYDAVNLAGRVTHNLMQYERLVQLADELAGAWTEEEVSGPAVVAIAAIAVSLWRGGFHERAEALHTRIEAAAEQFGDNPAVSGPIYRERAIREQFAGNPGAYIALCQRAIQCNEQAGDSYKACGNRIHLGYAECQVGAYAEAAAVLREAVAEAEQMGLDYKLGIAWQNLGFALGHLGVLAEARAIEGKAIAFFTAQGNRQLEGVSCAYLARILLSAGELEEAEAQARRAVQLLEAATRLRIPAQATLAQILLMRGRLDEALAEARAAMTWLTSFHKVDEGEVLTRTGYAEVLFATGDRGAALLALADARDRLLAAAARIEDPRWRNSFLHNVPENARTLELARQWFGDMVGSDP